MLDQVEGGGRAGFGELSGRGRPRGTGLLGDLDDDAVGDARVQERLFPVWVGQVDPDGLDAEGTDPGQCRPMSSTTKLKWCGPAPRAARKRSRKAASGPPEVCRARVTARWEQENPLSGMERYLASGVQRPAMAALTESGRLCAL